jgi:hypothetical protein
MLTSKTFKGYWVNLIFVCKILRIYLELSVNFKTTASNSLKVSVRNKKFLNLV